MLKGKTTKNYELRNKLANCTYDIFNNHKILYSIMAYLK